MMVLKASVTSDRFPYFYIWIVVLLLLSSCFNFFLDWPLNLQGLSTFSESSALSLFISAWSLNLQVYYCILGKMNCSVFVNPFVCFCSMIKCKQDTKHHHPLFRFYITAFLYFWFFSHLVGRKGSRIRGFKGSSD
jgi:hypothetical protein